MKKILFLFLICLVVQTMLAQRPRYAVLQFEAAAGISITDVDGIAEMFGSCFRPSGYDEVDRTFYDEILREQALQHSATTENLAVQRGKIRNVSRVIIGKVSPLGGLYNVEVRVIDVQTETRIAKQGKSIRKGQYFRDDVCELAREIAGMIAIKPGSTVNYTSHPAQPTSPSQPTKPQQRKRSGVEVLYGYLKVFPKELGKFPSEPKTIIKRINQQAQYGYNNWRLPTEEEEALLRAEEKYIEEGQQYMTYESRTKEGIVLLVSDGEDFATIKRAEKARKDSIDAAEEKARQDSIAEENRIAEEARIAAAKMKARQDSIAEVNRIEEEARIAAAKEKARQDSIAEAARIVVAKEKARRDSLAVVEKAQVKRRLNELQDSIAKARDYKYKKRIRELEEQGWCDLGLPSGTLWRLEDEAGFYSYSEAIHTFGAQLPNKTQWEELKKYCKIDRASFESGPYSVIGPQRRFRVYGHFNNNYDLIQDGGKACYWSSSPRGSDQGWAGIIRHVVQIWTSECKGCDVMIQNEAHSDICEIEAVPISTKLSVRLVKKDIPFGYVDLGLPSGTLWKDQNEDGGFYTYEQAIEKFGSKLPTKEQFEELKNSCTWSRIEGGFKVIGPNGESIILPAAGWRYCDGPTYNVGASGIYWSSTPNNSEYAWYLDFYSGVNYNRRCLGYSVRLVR